MVGCSDSLVITVKSKPKVFLKINYVVLLTQATSLSQELLKFRLPTFWFLRPEQFIQRKQPMKTFNYQKIGTDSEKFLVSFQKRK
jgi:hypothetical protein